jgi:ribosome-associated toxin RatA of RatAB toxin-antitoxin module
VAVVCATALIGFALLHVAMRSVAASVQIDEAGLPRGATAEARFERPVADVWKVVTDVDKYAERIPMMHRVRMSGDRATIDLKFKIALFSVGFQFVVDVVREHERSLEMRWVSGEPRGIRLRFDLEPTGDGKACHVKSTGEFDALSLGWLAKYFLKHHPEIQFGVMPGVAVGLLEAMRAAVAKS